MNTSMPTELVAIGDALERAARVDLESGGRLHAPRRRRSRRVALVLVALVVVLPGGALAASDLLSDDQVAASLPAGTLALGGTEPSCTAVDADVEYHCALAKPPSDVGAPEAGQWLGTVEPTVNPQTRLVNGGCRALNAAGTDWECYIGNAAVRQKIISQGFLGQSAPGPGVG